MKFYLLSDNTDTKTGMRLAGVEGEVVHTKEEFTAAFKRSVADKDIAILLITQKLAALVPEYTESRKSAKTLPLIVVLPDRHGLSRTDDYILKYVKEAIGISL